jgi:hypothetical protein
MAVFGGVVRGVYRIESWYQPSKAEIAAKPNRANRWGFRGMRDSKLEARYLNRDVSSQWVRVPLPLFLSRARRVR